MGPFGVWGIINPAGPSAAGGGTEEKKGERIRKGEGKGERKKRGKKRKGGRKEGKRRVGKIKGGGEKK